MAAIPRGGTLDVSSGRIAKESPKFDMTVTGKMLRVPPKFDGTAYRTVQYGAPPDEPVDAHSVQFYYTLLLASEAGMTIDIASMNEEKIVFSACLPVNDR
jgi:histidine phosphotransferase ChpT